MKWQSLLLFAGCMLLVAADAKKDPAQEDQAKLQGAWNVVGLEVEGRDEINNVKDLKLVFKEDKLSAQGDFDNKDKYGKLTCKIDPTTNPKILDGTLAAGDDKGTVLEGIYELDGDKLKICIRLLGKERPTEFATKAGSGLVLITLERAK